MLADGLALARAGSGRLGRQVGSGHRPRAAVARGLDHALQRFPPLRQGARKAQPWGTPRGRVLLGRVGDDRGDDLPRERPRIREIASATVFGLLCSGALRFLYERAIGRIYRRGFGQTPILLVGDDEGRRRLRRMMEHVPGAYALAGEVDLGSGAYLASVREMLDRTEARGVVLVGAESLPDEELLDLVHSVRLRGVPLRVVPGAFALMRGRTILSEGMGLPSWRDYPGLDNTQRTLKRVLDVTVSLAGLVLLSPLFLAVALAVRLDSPGPVLFRQKRVGADEKVFVCYMFRSMQRDAEVRQPVLEDLNELKGPAFKLKEDPRVTRVGRFLRRWSIDESPQLVNVLKGEMSLVGPRHRYVTS